MIGTDRRFPSVMGDSDVRRVLRTVGGLAVVLLLGGACRGGEKTAPKGDDGPGTERATVSTGPSSTVPPSTADQDRDVAAAVEAAYREATAAEIQYMSETGPFNPDIYKDRAGRFLTGTQYEVSFKEAQRRRLLGEVFDPPGLQPGEIAPVVTVEGPGRATVRDCAADHPTVKAATGERVDEPSEGRELVVIEMVLEDGHWKIASSSALGQSCTV